MDVKAGDKVVLMGATKEYREFKINTATVKKVTKTQIHVVLDTDNKELNPVMKICNLDGIVRGESRRWIVK